MRLLSFLSSSPPITHLPSPPCYSHTLWYQQTIEVSLQFYLWNELKRKMVLVSLHLAYPNIPPPTLLVAPRDFQKTSFNLSKCSSSSLPRRGYNSSLGRDENSCHLSPVSTSPCWDEQTMQIMPLWISCGREEEPIFGIICVFIPQE